LSFAKTGGHPSARKTFGMSDLTMMKRHKCRAPERGLQPASMCDRQMDVG
jgi:hypothetical protein